MSASERAGLPVFAEGSHLLSVKVSKEHARHFPRPAARALAIPAGPFRNQDIAGVQEVGYGEVDVDLPGGGCRPVVMNRFAADDGLSKRILFVAGVAGEEAGRKIGVAVLPSRLVLFQEILGIARA